MILRGESEGLADVAEHHVSAADLGERLAKRLGNRFLDERFFGPDAQITRNDFHHVFDVAGAGLPEHASKESGLLGLRPGSAEIVEEFGDGGKRKIGIPIVTLRRSAAISPRSPCFR